jgi:hypothetical protein
VDEATKLWWAVISMRNDWPRIFVCQQYEREMIVEKKAGTNRQSAKGQQRVDAYALRKDWDERKGTRARLERRTDKGGSE